MAAPTTLPQYIQLLKRLRTQQFSLAIRASGTAFTAAAGTAALKRMHTIAVSRTGAQKIMCRSHSALKREQQMTCNRQLTTTPMSQRPTHSRFDARKVTAPSQMVAESRCMMKQYR
jgi:hypothetical protein